MYTDLKLKDGTLLHFFTEQLDDDGISIIVNRDKKLHYYIKNMKEKDYHQMIMQNAEKEGGTVLRGTLINYSQDGDDKHKTIPGEPE